MFSWFLDLLFPPFCTSCGQLGAFLCDVCETEIELIAQPLPLPSPAHLDQLRAAAWYQEPLKTLLHTYKYQSVKEIGVSLGEFLAQNQPIPIATCCTAVPLHRQRQRDRGFNQSEVIAQTYARALHLFYQPLLQRVRFTVAQAQLTDKNDRQKNITNCFQLSTPLQKLKPSWWTDLNAIVIVIDDVTTTGSTLNECARVLKESGFAGAVIGLTVAHGK